MRKIFKYLLAFILSYLACSVVFMIFFNIIISFVILIFTFYFDFIDDYFSMLYSSDNNFFIAMHGFSVIFGLIFIRIFFEIVNDNILKVKNNIKNKKVENNRKKKLNNLFNKNLVD